MRLCGNQKFSCTFAKIICSVERAKKYEYIDDYLLKIRSKSRYSITLKELNRIFDFFGQVFRRKLYCMNADNSDDN
jgi:DNA polymerase I-like protein with 3'-5' exonuclease and polymerase domains